MPVKKKSLEQNFYRKLLKISKQWLSLILVFFALLSLLDTQGHAALTNGDFNTDLSGWTAVGATHVNSDGDAALGCAELTGALYIHQDMAFVAGTPFTLALSYKAIFNTALNNLYPVIYFKDVADQTISFDQILLSPEVNWTSFSRDYTAPAGCTYIRIQLFSRVETSARYDDISISIIVNEVPLADGNGILVTKDIAESITLTGSDNENAVLSFRTLTNPTNGNLTGTAPNLTYTPDAAYTGSDSFTFDSYDGVNYSSSATISLYVEEPKVVSNGEFRFNLSDWSTTSSNYLTTDGNTDLGCLELTNGGYAIQDIPFVASTPFTLEIPYKAVFNTALNNLYPTITFKDVADQTISSELIILSPEVNWTSFSQDYTAPAGCTYIRIQLFSRVETSARYDDISITILPNEVPLADGDGILITKDIAEVITLTGSDNENAALSFQTLTNPTNGNLTGTAPNLTYTPNAGYTGPDSFTFDSYDGVNYSSSATISLYVEEAKIVSNGEFRFNQNDWTPSNSVYLTTDGGVDLGCVEITNSGYAIQDIPFAQNTTFSFDLSYKSIFKTNLYTLYPFVSFYNASNQVIKLQLLTLLPQANWTASSRNFTAPTGTVSLRIQLVSRAETDARYDDISISLIPNTAPAAIDQQLFVDENTATPMTLTGSDVENADLTFQVLSNPSHGTLSGTAPNLTYTPDTDYVGLDSYTFDAYDGQAYSGSGTISIDIFPDAIVSNGAFPYDLRDWATLNASHIPTDGNIDLGSLELTGNGYAIQDIALAEHSTFTLFFFYKAILNTQLYNLYPFVDFRDAGGASIDFYQITLSPETNWTSYGRNFTVPAGATTVRIQLLSRTETDARYDDVSISLSTNSPPVAEEQNIFVAENTPIAITVVATDLNNANLDLQVLSGPANGSLTGTIPNFTYTPDPGFTGLDFFNFNAYDGQAYSSTATISIDVGPLVTYYNYLVVDISGGSAAITYPYQLLNEVPSDLLSNSDYTSSKIILRKVPAGVFTREDGLDIIITKDYYLGVFEVTQGQWENVIGNKPGYYTGDSSSVNTISWSDARGGDFNGSSGGFPGPSSFMGQLTSKVGISFDLPTEAQWELACRAGSTTKWSYGDYADERSMWYTQNTGSLLPHEVGMKLPNAWGFYDMHGNQWEYCLDWFSTEDPASANPSGPTGGFSRVARGGHYGSSAIYTYSSSRGSWKVNDQHRVFGFRCLVSSDVALSTILTVADDQSVSVIKNTATTITLTASGVENIPLTYQNVSAPANGVLSGVAPSLTYTPAANFTGADSFTFDIFNGTSTSNVGTVSLNVDESTAFESYILIDLSGGASATSYSYENLEVAPSDLLSNSDYTSSKILLKKISAGTFLDEGQTITITADYYMGVFEVTQGQWINVIGSTPGYFVGEFTPVNQVSWDEVRGGLFDGPLGGAPDPLSFIGKISSKTGLSFDLPSEAQWEYACRAGSTSNWSYGNVADGDYMWYSSNTGSLYPHAVGGKIPNPWGLYDVHGNMWEYCLDWFGTESAVTAFDPMGPTGGFSRVQRGGHFGATEPYTFSTSRGSWKQDKKHLVFGFRLLMK